MLNNRCAAAIAAIAGLLMVLASCARHESDVSADSGNQSDLRVSIEPSLFETDGAAGAPAPYSDESVADEFAIGIVEEVVEKEEARYLPLKLTKVFLGRLPTGTFLAEDQMVVRIECSLPPVDLGRRSQLYKPGSKVVVYLSREKNGEGDGDWVVSSLVPIGPAEEPYWLQRLQTFTDIVRAAKAEKPEVRFRELLVLQPNGGFDDTLYHAIMIHPHPAARPVVRDLWRQRVALHPIDPEENDMVGALSLVYLMRNLNDGQLVDEIFTHASRQKAGRRGYYIGQLEILASYADKAARDRLKRSLQAFLDDSPRLEKLDRVEDADVWSDVSIAQQTLQSLD